MRSILHLHPLWQLQIINDLSVLFPSTQFVATSHSPLIVQVAGDKSKSDSMLKKDEDDNVQN